MNAAGDSISVTVVIPAFNRSATIARAVRSAQGQLPHAPHEIIVVDDASSDDTAEIARALGARVLRHESNRGAAAARNTAIQNATGDWLAFLDSDDEWLPNHLNTLWPLRDGRVVVASSAVVRRSGMRDGLSGPATDSPILLASPLDVVWPENPVMACATLASTAAVREVGGLRTDLRFAEDFDLLLRLLSVGTGIVVPQVTAVYHHHPAGKSRNQSAAYSAHEEIVEAYSDSPWFDRRFAERRRGARHWDLFRASLRDRERMAACREALAMVSGLQAAIGVLGVLNRRRLVRRRARRVGATGAGTPAGA